MLGDRVQFILELNNGSNVSINRATVELIEKTEYYAYYPRTRSRETCRTLWRHEFRGNTRPLVGAMQSKIQNDLKLKTVYCSKIYFLFTSLGFVHFTEKLFIKRLLTKENNGKGCRFVCCNIQEQGMKQNQTDFV